MYKSISIKLLLLLMLVLALVFTFRLRNNVIESQHFEQSENIFGDFDSVSHIGLSNETPRHMSGQSFTVFEEVGEYTGMGVYEGPDEVIMLTVYFDGDNVDKIEVMILNDNNSEGFVYKDGFDMSADEFIDKFEHFEYEHIKEGIEKTSEEQAGETA